MSDRAPLSVEDDIEVAARPVDNQSETVPAGANPEAGANESYFEQSTDNEDIEEVAAVMTRERSERLRRLSYYQGKISRYE